MMVLNLPQELLEEILCRVPATSLKQLRLTCKEWNRLFNDRTFSRKHFDKAPKQFLITVLEERCRLSSLSINLHSGFPSEEFTGELSPIDYHSNSSQVIIMKIFHCDGLFLCTILKDTRIVVWNPCTGQKKWIQTGENLDENGQDFVLGYYQDNKSSDKSYKILSYKGYNYGDQEFKIYDIKSNTWRNLDVTPIPGNYFTCSDYRVSLKGNTYWFAYDLKDEQLGLISFDYTTERFERLWLPFQCDISDHDYSLSVVGEEKLSVVLQLKDAPRREIWITNKMDDETKEMSWRKLFEVEVGTRYYMWSGRPFLVDEEKKIVVCCEKCQKKCQPVITVSMVEADSNATRVYFPVVTMTSYWPHFVDYVPSLIQIQQSEANEKELNS